MRKARRLAVVTFAIGMAAGATPGTVRAQFCAPQLYAWSPPTTNTGAGPATAPASDPSDAIYYPWNPIIYLAQGDTLYAIRKFADQGQPGGSIKWKWQSGPLAHLPSSPNPVRTRGREIIFLTSQNGFLYKLAAEQGTTLLSRDTRRRLGGVLVCPFDGIQTTPAVQLYDLSNSAFQAAADAAGHCGDDLIFIATANSCGDETSNRVVAFWASDLSIHWTFNADFSKKLDQCVGGLTIDYATNSLFFGTDLSDAHPQDQNSLFALDAITGSLSWSTHSSAILNRPLLLAGRLYVADKPGSVMAYDPAGNGMGGGAPLWSVPLPVASPGAIISRNMAHGPAVGPFAGRLLVVDTGGTLYAIQDNDTSGTVLWYLFAENGVRYCTSPAVLEFGASTLAYVGRDDGSVQQIRLAASKGNPEGAMAVTPFASDAYDPAIDVEPQGYRLVIAAGDRVTRLLLPLCSVPPY